MCSVDWDFDCKIIVKSSHSQLIGFHLMPTCSNTLQTSVVTSTSKRLRQCFTIRNECMDFLKTHWNINEEYHTNDTYLLMKPFKVCVIDNFLDNSGYLMNKLLNGEEFHNLNWTMRTMDLYELFQTRELEEIDLNAIQIVLTFLQTELMQWINNLTGYNVTRVTATLSLYTNTDYLLIHDDKRGSRKVAFILYLNRNWKPEYGGNLQLFDTNIEDEQPKNIVHSIEPSFNRFVFFPVTNLSHHQVSEVLSMEHYRITINGWFHVDHSAIIPTCNTSQNNLPIGGLYSDIKFNAINVMCFDWKNWIKNTYFLKEICQDIRNHFEENSEISLENFLHINKVHLINDNLMNANFEWNQSGPLNHSNYFIGTLDNIHDGALVDLITLFQSNYMFEFLQRCTGLDLKCMRYEIQKWTPGCYSLLNGFKWNYQGDFELDVMIYFGCKHSSDVLGARTQYVTMDEKVQTALITIEPVENQLNIIYRDTARLTKYYGKLSRLRQFYALVCTYSECEINVA